MSEKLFSAAKNMANQSDKNFQIKDIYIQLFMMSKANENKVNLIDFFNEIY